MRLSGKGLPQSAEASQISRAVETLRSWEASDGSRRVGASSDALEEVFVFRPADVWIKAQAEGDATIILAHRGVKLMIIMGYEGKDYVKEKRYLSP